MFEDLKFKKSVSLCTKGSCCGNVKLSSDEKWVIFEDDFNGTAKIPANEENIIRAIKELFHK
jgi:hypothetical protein